jgi:hypothetical protein
MLQISCANKTPTVLCANRDLHPFCYTYRHNGSGNTCDAAHPIAYKSISGTEGPILAGALAPPYCDGVVDKVDARLS